MTTPILIKRCKETLKKFLDDEIKSGAMPLARYINISERIKN